MRANMIKLTETLKVMMKAKSSPGSKHVFLILINPSESSDSLRELIF